MGAFGSGRQARKLTIYHARCFFHTRSSYPPYKDKESKGFAPRSCEREAWHTSEAASPLLPCDPGPLANVLKCATPGRCTGLSPLPVSAFTGRAPIPGLCTTSQAFLKETKAALPTVRSDG